MLATLLALAAAAGAYFRPVDAVALPAMALGAVVLPTLYMAAYAMLTPALARADYMSTPRVFGLYSLNTSRRLAGLASMFYPVLTLGMALWADVWWVFAAWLVATGAAIDGLRAYLRVTLSYLDPPTAIEMVAERAKAAARMPDETDLCHWLEALVAAALKGIISEDTMLARQAIHGSAAVVDEYVNTLRVAGPNIETPPLDRLNYVLSRLLRGLETVSSRAIDDELEAVASAVSTCMGKLCLSVAHFDVGTVSFPLHFLGSIATRASRAGLAEVAVQASVTIEEIAKALLEDPRVSGNDLKTPLLTLLRSMQEMAQDAFRQDKTINIQMLTRPFQEIKRLLQHGPLAQHGDVPAIVSELDIILDEFAALGQVMARMPLMPPPSEQEMEEEKEREKGT